MSKSRSRAPGQVRIIGGRWRGRKLPVPDLPGLRPTSDRGREILFNWLQPWIAGARCADLFAGSGALGFEAASRGAAQVDFVEISPPAVSALAQSRATLEARNTDIHRANVLEWLNGAQPGQFDIVFLDPPFDSGLAIHALARIRERGCVAEGGFVYVESPSRYPALIMAAPFSVYREKTVGDSRLQLFRAGTLADESSVPDDSTETSTP